MLSYIKQFPGHPNLYRMRLGSIIHHLFRRRSTARVNTTPPPDISIPRYMGRWYEQARFENWFESGMEHVYTDYKLSSDGSISITNTGRNERGVQSSARGRGVTCGTGRFRVSFVPPYKWFRAPYHILYVDKDYNSALVSGDGNDYLWLLTRQQTPDKSILTPLLEEAQLRGFDTSKLRYTIQES